MLEFVICILETLVVLSLELIAYIKQIFRFFFLKVQPVSMADIISACCHRETLLNAKTFLYSTLLGPYLVLARAW